MTKGNEISIYNESRVFEKKSSIMKVSNNSKNYFEDLYQENKFNEKRD